MMTKDMREYVHINNTSKRKGAEKPEDHTIPRDAASSLRRTSCRGDKITSTLHLYSHQVTKERQ